ncbi:MAG: DMT family transporter [Treponema sp.]|nr:DMT family transporter [Treponema sp.]
MQKRSLRADIFLLLTAGIWGFGFVAQRFSLNFTGPFAYNGIRFILGSISLLPLIFIQKKITYSVKMPSSSIFNAKEKSGSLNFLIISLIAGSCMFVAVIVQQFGLIFTTAGKAGFITGLYVILTPIFGIFIGKKTGIATWIGSLFAIAGLYFVCNAGSLSSVNPGDIITMISALFWTCHVLLVDHFVKKINPIAFSAGQFAVCGILSLAGAFIAEPYIKDIFAWAAPALMQAGKFDWIAFPDLLAGISNGSIPIAFETFIPILYGGLASVGIAYTLQAVAQRDAPPAHATIILCFEGSFAALGGALLLSEEFSTATMIGFLLMLAGMISSQWEIKRRNEPPHRSEPTMR